MICPSAEWTVAGAVADAVHFSVRTSRGLLRDQTLIATSACLVHIEERDEVTFPECVSVDVGHRAPDFREMSDGYVAGNDRIRNATQLAMVKMHVRSAHFGILRAHHR